jgi:O-antigen ligase
MSVSGEGRLVRPGIDPLALFALAFGGLNLNGVLVMLTGTEAFLSPILGVVASWLLLRYFSYEACGGAVYVLFVMAILTYLSSASLFGMASGEFDSEHFRKYSNTLLFVSGLYFWLTGLSEERLDFALRRLKGIFILACIFTLLSQEIDPYFHHFEGARDRAHGLFGNPDEASCVALYCIILIFVYPAKRPLVTTGQFVVAIAALAFTFSKTGILILLILYALYAASRRPPPLLQLALVALFGLTFTLASALGIRPNFDFLALTRDQERRVLDLFSLFQGNFNDETTTGRTAVWHLGIARIWESLPWGNGLGRFHALEGGWRGLDNKWLGIHDTYLMILGEAGLGPFVIFIAFLATMTARAVRSTHAPLATGLLLVTLGDMLGSENVLGLRASNVVLAVLIAIASRQTRGPRWEPTVAGRDRGTSASGAKGS